MRKIRGFAVSGGFCRSGRIPENEAGPVADDITCGDHPSERMSGLECGSRRASGNSLMNSASVFISL